MNRRDFVTRSLLGTTAAGATLVLLEQQACSVTEQIVDPELVHRLKLAMLSMQRYSWEQGVSAQALLEWGDVEAVVLMAKDAVLRQLEDGRLAVVSENHGVTDPAANGEAVLKAAQITGDEDLRQGAQRMLDYLMKKAPRSNEGVLYHVDHLPQVWIDSAYMAPPFLAVAGKLEEAVRQIEGMRALLWNEEKKLFHQIWDDGKQMFHEAARWGVGNGWAAAGIARVVGVLPANMTAEKKRLVTYVKEIIDGCLANQRPDGLFHNFVDDSSTFVETNLAQMLAYTIYRGVTGGWLDGEYIARAQTMRMAALAKVDHYGLVQGVCGAPNFESSGTATEGQAFAILMLAAYRDWKAKAH